MDTKKMVKKATNSMVQFVAITPEEVNKPILDVIKEGFTILQNKFQPKQQEEYLTRNETAELLKVDLSTIWSWSKRGKLKSYGIGHRVYYKRSEVEQAIKPLNQ